MAVPFQFLVSDVFCLAGLLTLGEGIAGHRQISQIQIDIGRRIIQSSLLAYLDAEPPDLGAPVSPSAALMTVEEKDLRTTGVALASLTTCVRNIVEVGRLQSGRKTIDGQEILRL